MNAAQWKFKFLKLKDKEMANKKLELNGMDIRWWTEALRQLKPDLMFSLTSEGDLEYQLNTGEPPSDYELRTKAEALEAEWNLLEYARLRRREYLALNQLELMFDDAQDGGTRWADAVNAIKAKYPKP